MFLNLTPTPKIAPKYQKIAPKDPKNCKKAQNVAKFKTKKVRTVLPKHKLIVYIGGPKKVFEPDLSPKKALSLFNIQFRLSNSKFLNSEFRIFKFQVFKFRMFKFQMFIFRNQKFRIFKLQILKL